MLNFPGSTARFTWNDGAPQEHNVNYLNQLSVPDPESVYESCDFTPHPGIKTVAENPNKEFAVTKADNNPFQYFVCGVGNGYHCKHGVKAKFYVVEHNEHCPFHSYGTCDEN